MKKVLEIDYTTIVHLKIKMISFVLCIFYHKKVRLHHSHAESSSSFSLHQNKIQMTPYELYAPLICQLSTSMTSYDSNVPVSLLVSTGPANLFLPFALGLEHCSLFSHKWFFLLSRYKVKYFLFKEILP